MQDNTLVEQTLSATNEVTVEDNNLNLAEEVSLKKFKNVEALQGAYTNLEKEFTKKCQQLKEFEKGSVNKNNSIENNIKFNASLNQAKTEPLEKQNVFNTQPNSTASENRNANENGNANVNG
ncbi:MAG: hypothetical protein RR454_07445, partial [Clostridia bacterium]